MKADGHGFVRQDDRIYGIRQEVFLLGRDVQATILTLAPDARGTVWLRDCRDRNRPQIDADGHRGHSERVDRR